MTSHPSFVGEPIQVGQGQVFVNPGTGPVEDADADTARKNMRQFIADLGLDGVRLRRIRKQDYGEGRFAFRLWLGPRCCDIQMPGLPVERVRYISREQNPWHYPRLYVEGSSWLWVFALNCAKSELTEEPQL